MSLVANSLYIFESNNWVSEADLLELRAHPLPPMSVVFGKIGEGLKRNRCRVLTRPTLIDNNMMGAIPNSLVDQRFFAIVMSQIDMGSLAEGSALPYLRAEDVGNVRVLLPPLDEQRAIAGVLGVLDGKIDSNRRMADLLIRLARTMMSVGQYEARLGDIAKCERGLSYKGDGLEENSTLGVPMINLANFGVDGWLNAEKMKFYSGEYKDRHLLKAGDLVVANTDLTQQRVIIGRPALVPPELGRAIFTHHVTAIRPLEDEELTFPIWAQLNSPGFRERAEGFATGTTVAGMPVETLLDFQVQIPDGGVIREARELLQRVWAAETESRSLIRTRDTLLPELLSGRLRVKDAESMMENV